jgi:hypothetical protein
MEAVRVQKVMAEDGKIEITDLPYKKGQAVEIIVLPHPTAAVPDSRLTAKHLRTSGIIGLWKDRDDIQDSSDYARKLREQAQTRGDINDASAG